MKDRIGCREAGPGDRAFLYRVYASTRADEMALVNWSDREKRNFLEMQFHAQDTYYREQFTAASFQLIELDGEPVGRLYLDDRADEIRLIDIALLPEFRGNGIGGHLMRTILQKGQEENKPVRIHVERNNPALRLYERLGFRQIGDVGVYFFMEWLPEREPNGN